MGLVTLRKQLLREDHRRFHCDSKDTTAVPAVASLLACGAINVSADLRTFAFDCDHHLHGRIVGADSEMVDNKHVWRHRCVSRRVRKHHRHKEVALKETGSRLLPYITASTAPPVFTLGSGNPEWFPWIQELPA